MTALRMEGVGHAYFGRTTLDAISLEIGPAEIVALVGPSGCGKSTLVHIACGLVEPLRGRVRRAYRRHGMVFQEPRLLPWATAGDNITYPLRLAGVSSPDRCASLREVAARVSLEEADLAKFPVELSGGMRQRAAIARALAAKPDFVFFDEPFTALDVALKRRMQDLVIAAAREASFAALFVTHDLAEAVRIAHRILVLDSRGRGIAGARTVPLAPGERDDATVFAAVRRFLHDDPIFREIHKVDERRLV